MICQLIVIAFILFMAFWWANQGGFNAFVHLVSVVIAGAITFALWEPLTLGFLMARMPQYSWGVSYLCLFALSLLIVRKILDLTVKKNLYFGQIPNLILGGLIGFLSGILTAGVTLIGIAFLPIEADILGYQPVAIGEKSQPVRKDSLWIPADDYAARFYAHLSLQTFSSSTPLAVYRPDIFMEAHSFRLKDDPNSSPVTNPDSVEIGDIALPAGGPVSIPILQAQQLGATGGKLDGRVCAINTKWVSKPPGTYDGDGLVRVYPTQVRLVLVSPTEEESVAIPPQAFSVVDPNKRGKARIFVPFVKDTVQATNSGDTDFTFIFVIPEAYATFTPKFLALRSTRFNLPAPDTFKPDPASLAYGLGVYTPPEVAPVVVPEGGKPTGGESRLAGSAIIGTLDPNPALPMPIDRNMVRGSFTYSNSEDILNGNSVVGKPFEGRIDRKVRTERLAQPAGTAILRAQFEPIAAASLLGSAVAAAASVQAIYIQDAGGQQYLPIGYVWFKTTGETQIKIDRSDLLRSAREVPFREVGTGDQLFLYWQVPKGTKIVSLHIGQKTTYNMDVKAP